MKHLSDINLIPEPLFNKIINQRLIIYSQITGQVIIICLLVWATLLLAVASVLSRPNIIYNTEQAKLISEVESFNKQINTIATIQANTTTITPILHKILKSMPKEINISQLIWTNNNNELIINGTSKNLTVLKAFEQAAKNDFGLSELTSTMLTPERIVWQAIFKIN
ncbi:MAG: hypothetical protein AAB657_03570 [Patescibacteria group bacterium]